VNEKFKEKKQRKVQEGSSPFGNEEKIIKGGAGASEGNGPIKRESLAPAMTGNDRLLAQNAGKKGVPYPSDKEWQEKVGVNDAGRGEKKVSVVG